MLDVTGATRFTDASPATATSRGGIATASSSKFPGHAQRVAISQVEFITHATPVASAAGGTTPSKDAAAVEPLGRIVVLQTSHARKGLAARIGSDTYLTPAKVSSRLLQSKTKASSKTKAPAAGEMALLALAAAEDENAVLPPAATAAVALQHQRSGATVASTQACASAAASHVTARTSMDVEDEPLHMDTERAFALRERAPRMSSTHPATSTPAFSAAATMPARDRAAALTGHILHRFMQQAAPPTVSPYQPREAPVMAIVPKAAMARPFAVIPNSALPHVTIDE